MQEREPRLYNTLIIYTPEETFTTRWQWFGRTALLVHKERFLWIENRVMQIPLTDGNHFFFDHTYVLIRHQNTMTLGVLADANHE